MVSRNNTIRKRVELGICPRCGELNTTERYLCDKCRIKKNEEDRERKLYRELHGLCPRCGELNTGKRYLCDTCSEKANLNTKRYRRKHKDDKK